MVELEESAVFPVVLYDGEREIDVGDIKIHQTLDFKRFQLMLKEIIGISYNNLTTYMVDSKKSKLPSERRKILITGKVNFSVLVQETDCFFLAVLKRSRRDRRRKVNKQSGLEFALAPYASPEYLFQPQLNQLGQMYGYDRHFYDDRFHDLQMNLISNSKQVFYSPSDVSFPIGEEAYSSVQRRRSRALCKDCSEAEEQGKTAPFHFCVYDNVIAGGFRSRAGPISRPR